MSQRFGVTIKHSCNLLKKSTGWQEWPVCGRLTKLHAEANNKVWILNENTLEEQAELVADKMDMVKIAVRDVDCATKRLRLTRGKVEEEVNEALGELKMALRASAAATWSHQVATQKRCHLDSRGGEVDGGRREGVNNQIVSRGRGLSGGVGCFFLSS